MFAISATTVIGVAGLALSAYGAIDSANAQKAQANGATALGRAQLKERNANANTERFISSLNNKKKGRALDKNIAAAQANLGRSLRTAERGRIEQRLQQAEGLGAYTAHSAMKGQQGGSLDIVEQTMRLRNSRQNQQAQEAQDLLASDGVSQIGNVLRQGFDSLEMGVLGGGQDNSRTYAQGPNVAGLVGGALMGSTGSLLASVLGSIGKTEPASFTMPQQTSFSKPTSFSFKPQSTYSWGIQ